MNKKDNDEDSDKEDNKIFMPTSFATLVNYFSYKMYRKNVMTFIDDK